MRLIILGKGILHGKTLGIFFSVASYDMIISISTANGPKTFHGLRPLPDFFFNF